MKIKLIFDAQFCGYAEKIIDVPKDYNDEDIKRIFEKEMGLKFDCNCYYEIIEENYSEYREEEYKAKILLKIIERQ